MCDFYFFYVFMKKFISAFSVVVLSMFNIISPATYALEWDESSCFVVEDGFITDYSCSETDLTIPSSIGGVDVVWVGAQAFRWKWLTSLTIEEWVKVIWKRAFAENQLTSIELPSSLESIEEAAFNKNLIEWDDAFIYTIWSNRLVSYAWMETSITIPSGVTSIGASAFRDMWITDVTIPSSVTNIGYMAFAGNELTDLSLPSNIITIWSYAFERNDLSSLVLSNSIQEIDKGAFCDQKSVSEVSAKIVRDFSNEFDDTCLDLSRIYSLTFMDRENVILTSLYNEWENIQFPDWDYVWVWWFDGETQYSEWAVMPGKDLTLTTKALSGCFVIDNSIITKYICDDTYVTIPNTVDGQNVVWIWTWVFENRWITNLVFETEHLESIYKDAFSYNNLTQVDIPDTVKYIWDSAFRSKDDNTSTKITTLRLWNSVEIIDEHAFAYNRITTLNIPSSVERIEKWAFRDNKNIKDLVIPWNVKFIWEAAFRNNDNMTNLTIENWVEEIWTWAFYNDKLKSINIPNSVKYIRDSAFRNNTYNNYTVSIWNWLEYLWQWVFCKWQSISDWEAPVCDDVVISIDSESLERLWWVSQIESDHVDRDWPYLIIDSCTYYTVVFKDGDAVISSGKYLSWDAITYPANLKDDDERTFDGWDPNPTVMPNSDIVVNAKWVNKSTSGECFWTTELSDGTLQITSYDIDCGVDVVIPSKIDWKTVTSIWRRAFRYQPITSVKFPNTITSIWNEAFRQVSISEVVLPYSITSVWQWAFRWISTLVDIKIVNPNIVVTEWGAFYNTQQVKNFYVPSEITAADVDSYAWSSPHNYIPWWLVYYRDWSTLIDVELYENNADLWETIVLDDKEWFKFAWWDWIPANGKVTSNLNLTAKWRDESIIPITPDSCFWLYWPYSNKYWINSYDENCWDVVIMPNTINWKGIATFYDAPFKDKNIKKLVLPNTLESIWNQWVAYNPLLTEIEFPDSLTSIWDWAFRNDGLTWNIVFPNNLTSIWAYAFYANSINSVYIWENLNSVWQYAFCGRSDWKTKALLPKSISEYSSSFLDQLDVACLDYVQLFVVIFEDDGWNIISWRIYEEGEKIQLPDYDTYREWYEFLWWSGMPSDMTVRENLLLKPVRREAWSEETDQCFIYASDNLTLIDYVKGCGANVTIPSKTKIIKKDALKWKWLKSVTLNDWLLVIEEWAFENNNLIWLNLPSSVTSFDPNSLAWNQNLEKVRNSSWTTPDSCFTVHPNVWKYQITEYNTNCGSDIVIPSIITSDAWIYDSVNVPTREVWSIGGFSSYVVKKVEIPDTVTRISSTAFYWANLSEVVLHDWITEIWNNAFAWNANLERVFIGSWLLSSWASIGFSVFCKNSSDTTRRTWIVSTGNYDLVTQEIRDKFDAVCVGVVPEFVITFKDVDWSLIEERVFGSWEKISTPNVADNENWKVIWWIWLPKDNRVRWDMTLTAIRQLDDDEDIPQECFTIENWVIVDYVQTCESDVIVPSEINWETVVSIWDSAFKNKWLTSLVLPEWLNKIENSAFEGNNLKSLIIPNSVTEIWDKAFNSNQLETLKLSKNIDSIWDSAFANNKLTAVRIPLSINTVGDSAFCSASNSPVEWLISEDFPESKYGNFKNSCIELVKWLYLIIFDTAWWSPIPAIAWEYKDPINVDVPNPTWRWYRFLWWDKSIPSKMPADDVIITALWEKLDNNYSGWWKRVSVVNTDSHFAPGDISNPNSWDNIAWTWSSNVWWRFDKLKNKTLTRWNLAVITDMIVTAFPQLIEGRPVINRNCKDYTDYSIFSEKEKTAIEKLCKIWIMWIHNTTTKPLKTFKVKKFISVNQFELVMERTFKDYKDSILLDILEKVKWKDNIDLLTVYEILILIKNRLS